MCLFLLEMEIDDDDNEPKKSFLQSKSKSKSKPIENKDHDDQNKQSKEIKTQQKSNKQISSPVGISAQFYSKETKQSKSFDSSEIIKEKIQSNNEEITQPQKHQPKQQQSKHKHERQEEQTTSKLGPRIVKPIEFAKSRSAELKLFLESSKNKHGGKKIFQKLPRHLRRRTMSHNMNRIPRRLREAVKQQVCSCLFFMFVYVCFCFLFYAVYIWLFFLLFVYLFVPFKIFKKENK
jgi:hypothetical protein